MNKTYNILHVLGGLDLGGTETMVMNLYRNLNDVHYKFYFVSHNKNQNSYKKEILDKDGIVFDIPKYKIYNHFKYVKAWKKLLNENNFDIIHGHVRTTANIYLKLAKKKNIKTILHSHSTNSRGNFISRIIKKIYQSKATKYADSLFACSKEAAIWLFGKKTVGSKEFHLIPNGFDLDSFKFNETIRNEIRSKLNLKSEFIIGHVGTFTEAKNHKFIIEVFRFINQQDKAIKLMLIGDGILKSEIKMLVNKYNFGDNVIFVDSVTNIYDYYNAMDVFIFPSLFEGLGMALVEAQVNGLNCVVSNRIPSVAIVNKDVTIVDLNTKSDYWVNVLLNCKDKTSNRNIDLDKFKNYSIEYGTEVVIDYYKKLLGVED